MAKKIAEPSDKQMEVFRHLLWHIQEYGFQPSIGEMAEHFGVTKRAILDRLKLLEEKGFIKSAKNRDRAISLPYVKFRAITIAGENPS